MPEQPPPRQGEDDGSNGLARSAGEGDGPASRARLAEAGSFAAPIVLVVGMALAGGGFELSDRHVAGLAAWLVVIALIAFGAAGGLRTGRPLLRAVGLIGGLAALSALSALWSGSPERSVIEADRVVAYLGFFLAAFLIIRTQRRRQRFVEGLAIALALIALLALGNRLLPDVISVRNAGTFGPRLRYPLGYWNADGVVFGLGIVLSLWLSRQGSGRFLRAVAVLAIPVFALALYFTYSRGGVLAAVVGVIALLILSRDRLWHLATLAIALLGALPALIAVPGRHDLADGLVTRDSIHQGPVVGLILLAGMAAALLAWFWLTRIERRGGRRTARAVALSRNPLLLKRLGLACALVALVAAVALGPRAWDQFSSKDAIYFPAQPEQHFSQLSGAGRSEFWRVAIKAFEEEPVIGHGAGTYQFSWDLHRAFPMEIRDAHSLYLEAFAELGVLGGALVLALVGFLLWTAFLVWRDSSGALRERAAALFAVMTAFAIAAAIDWLWEVAALGAVFFVAAAVTVSARCAQTTTEPNPVRGRPRLALAGLALAWIAALALLGPLLTDREIAASRSAAAAGHIQSAIDDADTAREIEPWASSPYVQLGLLEEIGHDYPAAISRFGEAIDREPDNWQIYFLRARVEDEAGMPLAAQRDLARARELNPLGVPKS